MIQYRDTYLSNLYSTLLYTVLYLMSAELRTESLFSETTARSPIRYSVLYFFTGVPVRVLYCKFIYTCRYCKSTFYHNNIVRYKKCFVCNFAIVSNNCRTSHQLLVFHKVLTVEYFVQKNSKVTANLELYK